MPPTTNTPEAASCAVFDFTLEKIETASRCDSDEFFSRRVALESEGGMSAERFAVTFFRDHAATENNQQTFTVDELRHLIRETTAPVKEALPWLKLARFGSSRTRKGSLRHDRNVIAITGIEADYDGEKISFDEAVEIAEKAGLSALVYTSASHTPDAPRWRVLCPAGREHPPTARRHLLARVNGLYRGVFSSESWTLSQAYYFGSLKQSSAHRVEPVEGEAIDALDELDQIAIDATKTSRARTSDGSAGRASAQEDAESVRRIVTGEGYHEELCALAARYLGRGFDPRSTGDALRGLMLARPEKERDERWRDRYCSIEKIVGSAAEKFAPEADRRRAIARLTYQLVRKRCTGAEIKAAIIADAGRLNIETDRAIAIGARILSGTRRRHV